jgi:hypothetical protein
MTDLTNNLDPKEKVFRAWAPQESIWSPWVKPVLFASMNFLFPPSRPDPIEVDLSWISEGDGSALYILDLPGAAGVWASPALMKKGLQPIPLYNALPSPLGYIPSHADEGGPIVSRVEVVPIVAALWHLAPEIESIRLDPAAQPAFLLDWNRSTGVREVEPGDFDNRSISFPTDFPSANLLLSRNIRRVILVQNEGSQPQEDLAHTLRRWQDAGIRIELKALNSLGPPTVCMVQKPSRFRSLWYQILTRLGFRTSNLLGGFGRLIGEMAQG